MQNIAFDRISGQVKGIDRNPLNFEYEVKIPFEIQLSKTIQESTGNQIQKTTSDGLPLFKTNIQTTTDEFGNETTTWDETTEPTTVTEYQTVTNEYKVANGQYTTETVTNIDGSTSEVQIPLYDTITTTSQAPLTYVDNPPIMIPEVISKTVTLENSYFNFNYNEILEAKQQAINNNNILKIKYYDEDFDNQNLTLSNISHGDGLLVIHSGGIITTSEIDLSPSTSTFRLYIETQVESDLTVSLSTDNITFTPFVKNLLNLPSPVSKVYLQVKNNCSSNREVYALGLLGGIA